MFPVSLRSIDKELAGGTGSHGYILRRLLTVHHPPTVLQRDLRLSHLHGYLVVFFNMRCQSLSTEASDAFDRRDG